MTEDKDKMKKPCTECGVLTTEKSEESDGETYHYHLCGSCISKNIMLKVASGMFRSEELSSEKYYDIIEILVHDFTNNLKNKVIKLPSVSKLREVFTDVVMKKIGEIKDDRRQR